MWESRTRFAFLLDDWNDSSISKINNQGFVVAPLEDLLTNCFSSTIDQSMLRHTACKNRFTTDENVAYYDMHLHGEKNNRSITNHEISNQFVQTENKWSQNDIYPP